MATVVSSEKQQVLDAVEAIREELIELSIRIHANPELGRQEYQAARWTAELLERHGFEVQLGPGGVETAVVASAGRGSPVVGFLAEYDALPEVGHACGHNLLGTAAVGAAIALKALADAGRGTVKVFGTPAEELGWGKPAMLDAGLFDGVDVAISWHPYPGAPDHAGGTSGCLAVRGYQFTYHGRPAHSAVSPWEGVNALDAVIQLFNGVNAMRQQIRPDARIHGIISNGGQAFNIVPALAQARIACRAYDNEYVDEVARRIVACARGAAEQTGTRLDVEKIIHLDSIRFNPPLWESMAENLRLIGRQVAEPRPSPASTDFGNVSQALPSVACGVGTHPPGAVFHSKEFAEAAIAPDALAGMLDAARAMALTGADVLLDPELAARARAAHAGA